MNASGAPDRAGHRAHFLTVIGVTDVRGAVVREEYVP